VASVSATTGNANGLNFTGLATGIDTASIVTGLTKLNQQQIDSLNAQKATITTKQTTFVALQANLFDLQTKTNALARSAGGAFDGHTATTSDATAVTAVAGTAAIPGNYALTVKALAQGAQVASEGYADPNAAIKQGTLDIQVGSGTATHVVIDSRNNTLQGLADAVNAAGGDVRAAVINDGSATPYRLLLTSSQTGAANGISVTNNLTTGTGATIDPTNKVVQAASDAQVVVGSGTGALTVTSATNTVNHLIPGVSFNLLAADPNKSVTLTIGNNTDSTVKAVQDFVDSFNKVRDFLTQQTQFDPTSNSAGVLLGNSDVNALENDLSNALNASVPGLNPNANRLSSVGLAFNDKGDLTFDSSKLTAALSGTGGVSPADLKNLFALSGTSDNPGVQFSIGGNNTKPSSGTPYQVNVTSPATRASISATGAPAPSIIISPPDNALQVKVNGLLAAGITLDSGTYTPDTLASLLQQKINSAPELQGNLVSVGLDSGGKIQITSQTYGGASQVAVTGGSAASLLGFTGGETSTGTNVVGNFVVNGKTETATGTGQVLTGAVGNANTDGLQVRSSLTSAGTANVTVSQGLASRLNTVLSNYLDPSNGRLKTINDAFTAQTADIDKTISKNNDVLAAKTADLQAQFAAMETAVNNLKGVQNQLAGLGFGTSSSSGSL
jgi:flagellar hook-associated protein 2